MGRQRKSLSTPRLSRKRKCVLRRKRLKEELERKKAECNNTNTEIINSQKSSPKVIYTNVNIEETCHEKMQNSELHAGKIGIENSEEFEELIIEEIEFDEVETEKVEVYGIKTEEIEIDEIKTKEEVSRIKTEEIKIDEIMTEDSETEELKEEEIHMEDTYTFNHITNNSLPIDISINRSIVDFSFMWNEIHRTFDNHAQRMNCHFRDWKLVDSRCHELQTQLFFKCEMCHYETSIWSGPTKLKNKDINTAMVSATVKLGIRYSQLKQLCANMDMQCISNEAFTTYKKDIK